MTISEKDIVRFVARFVPWLAPVPSAWLVGRAVLAHLGFPLAVAIVTAATVETLGLVSVFNWQWFSGYERNRLKTDPAAQPWQPAALGGFYLVLVVSLVSLLEYAANGFSWSVVLYGVMPLLSLVGTINLALIAGQEQREADAEAAKAGRSRKREEAKERKENKQGQQARQGKASKARQATGARQGVLDFYASNPLATQAEAAQVLGVSRQAIGQHLGKLESEGIIERNGQGVKMR